VTISSSGESHKSSDFKGFPFSESTVNVGLIVMPLEKFL
jgi:hypothetical protein